MFTASVITGRKDWLDVAKGIGIIAVVIGHSGSREADLLYWFHMPLFFIISGFLFRPCGEWKNILSLVNKKARQLLIPYISFLGLIVIVEFYLNNRYLNFQRIFEDFLYNLFPGGRFIGGFYTPFWFITCLFVTQIAFAMILKAFKDTKAQLLIIVLAYILAHYESGILKTHNIMVPWDIDVTLLTLVYYSIGYYGKKILDEITPFISYASIALASSLIICGWMGLINYIINVKYLTCDHMLLDLIIPTVISVAIFSISQLCSNLSFSKFLGILGSYSLPIMYLHLPFNIIAHQYINNGPFIFAMIGLLIPTTLSYCVLERFRITQLCLLGINIQPHRRLKTINT
ncbi:MAG: Acyltransferase family protein [Pelotomaculum sp. PtaB.Bin104]|nr:MAG: Acyltransferase family protein [Pelotomaculum sp. PtaB.Bin104]